MNETLSAIDAISSTLKSRFPLYSDSIVKNVSDELKKAIILKGVPLLDKRDVEHLRVSLIAANNPRGHRTWLHHDAFNRLVYDLTKDQKLKSYYINTLIKLNRHVLTDIDDQTSLLISYAQNIRDTLLQFDPSPTDDIIKAEMRHVCCAFAACSIFALITFPNFHKSFFSLANDDICLAPAYLNIPFDDSETFYRYFLPAPAAIYVQRQLLFRLGKNTELKKLAAHDITKRILRPVTFSPANFPSIFERWMETILIKRGIVLPHRFKISDFRRAIIAMTISDFSGDNTINTYPPFLLAIQSRDIKSFSFYSIYLDLLLKGKKIRIRHESSIKTQSKHSPFPGISLLEKAVTDLRQLITPLKRIKPCKMKDRVELADNILSVASIHKQYLNFADYENLMLYAAWISSMLKDRSLTPKTVCDYSSGIPRLLYSLTDVGALFNLQKNQLIDIFRSTMANYNTGAIRDALKYFCEFIKSDKRPNFDMPDWMRTPSLFKHDIPTPKPLIDSRDICDVMSQCDKIIQNHHVFNIIDDIRYNSQLNKANRKSDAIKQMINLGFYAGLRISEIVNLKFHNIIYDDGIVICVRVTKTINGIRNVPFSKLAPKYVVESFINYVKINERLSDKSQFIFTQDNGAVFDPSYVSSEVESVFAEIGMGGIRFHHLRHSFCNFVLLRWFVLFHAEFEKYATPIMSDDLFSDESMNNLKELFLGIGPIKIGQDKFTYALAVLARLMGHGGPIITLENYVHTADWLFYLLSKRWDQKKVSLTSVQFQHILQLSHPSLPREFNLEVQRLRLQPPMAFYNRGTFSACC